MMFLGEINRAGRAMVWPVRNAKELYSFGVEARLHRAGDGPFTLDGLRKAADEQNRQVWAYATPFDLAAALTGNEVPAELVEPFRAALDRVQIVAMRSFQPPKP
jgi:hypothetical protein